MQSPLSLRHTASKNDWRNPRWAVTTHPIAFVEVQGVTAFGTHQAARGMCNQKRNKPYLT